MSGERTLRNTYLHRGTFPFWGVHVAAVVGVAILGFSTSGILLAAAFYGARMLFVCGGYHRYFSHRTYKTSRWFQFVLAFLAQTSLQRGALWWASCHRRHHRSSDSESDLHSAAQDGFWWSHIGWFLAPDYNATDHSAIRDLAKYPELRLLNRFPHAPGILLAAVLFAVGGAHALVWGFFVSTVLLWHGTFTINSLSHIWGTRRYETTDTSKNNWVLACVTLGEGWHNNHHYFQSSCNQGFYWWQVDVTDYFLRGLALTGLIRDLKRPPRRVLREGRGRSAAG